MKEGASTLIYPSVQRVEGEMRENQWIGKGTLHSVDGKIVNQVYRDDK